MFWGMLTRSQIDTETIVLLKRLQRTPIRTRNENKISISKKCRLHFMRDRVRAQVCFPRVAHISALVVCLVIRTCAQILLFDATWHTKFTIIASQTRKPGRNRKKVNRARHHCAPKVQIHSKRIIKSSLTVCVALLPTQSANRNRLLKSKAESLALSSTISRIYFRVIYWQRGTAMKTCLEILWLWLRNRVFRVNVTWFYLSSPDALSQRFVHLENVSWTQQRQLGIVHREE